MIVLFLHLSFAGKRRGPLAAGLCPECKVSSNWSSAVLGHILIVSSAFALDMVSSTCHISNPILLSKNATVEDNSQTARIAVLLTRND